MPDSRNGWEYGTIIKDNGDGTSVWWSDREWFPRFRVPFCSDYRLPVFNPTPAGFLSGGHNTFGADMPDIQAPVLVQTGLCLGVSPQTISTPVAGWLNLEGSDLHQSSALTTLPTKWQLDPGWCGLGYNASSDTANWAMTTSNVMVSSVAAQVTSAPMVTPITLGGPVGLVGWDTQHAGILSQPFIVGSGTLYVQWYINGVPDVNATYAPVVGQYLQVDQEWFQITDASSYFLGYISVLPAQYKTNPVAHNTGAFVSVATWIQGLAGSASLNAPQSSTGLNGTGTVPQYSGVYLPYAIDASQTQIAFTSQLNPLTGMPVAQPVVGDYLYIDFPLASPPAGEFMLVTSVQPPAQFPVASQDALELFPTSSPPGEWIVTVARGSLGSKPLTSGYTAGTQLWLIHGLTTTQQAFALAQGYPTTSYGIATALKLADPSSTGLTNEWIGCISYEDARGNPVANPAATTTTTVPPFTPYWYGWMMTNNPGALPGELGSLVKIDITTGNVIWQIPCVPPISSICIDEVPTYNGAFGPVMYVMFPNLATGFPPDFSGGAGIRIACYSLVDGSRKWKQDINIGQRSYIFNTATVFSKLYNGRKQCLMFLASYSVVGITGQPAEFPVSQVTLLGISKVDGSTVWSQDLHNTSVSTNAIGDPDYYYYYPAPYWCDVPTIKGVGLDISNGAPTLNALVLGVETATTFAELETVLEIPNALADVVCIDETGNVRFRYNAATVSPIGLSDGSPNGQAEVTVMAVDPTNAQILCASGVTTEGTFPRPWTNKIFTLDIHGNVIWTSTAADTDNFPESSFQAVGAVDTMQNPAFAILQGPDNSNGSVYTYDHYGNLTVQTVSLPSGAGFGDAYVEYKLALCGVTSALYLVLADPPLTNLYYNRMFRII